MTISDWQITLGSITLGPGSQYIVTGIEGFGTPDVRTTDSPRPQQHGDFAGLDTYASRTVTISLTVYGSDSASAVQAYDALLSEWQLRDGSADPRELSFQIPGRPAMALLGRPRRLSADSFDRVKTRRIDVQAEFYSPYAAIFSAGLASSRVDVGTTAHDRRYPCVYPRTYGGGSAGISVLENAGNIDYWPTVIISGPCVNPRIENITTGDVIHFSITLGAGDSLWVDMDARSVLLGNTANRRNVVSGIPAWWPLIPGPNQIRFAADSGDGSYALVQSRSAWLG